MAQEKNKSFFHTHISAKHHPIDLKIREVWQYRDLIVLFTKRSFTLTYKQTILGPAWIFLNPLISSLIYAFVFGGIAGMSTEGVPQILFYLCYAYCVPAVADRRRIDENCLAYKSSYCSGGDISLCCVGSGKRYAQLSGTKLGHYATGGCSWDYHF